MSNPVYPLPRPAASITFRVGAGMTLILAIVVLATIFAASRYGRSAADDAFDRLLKGAALQIAERVVVTDGEPVVDLPSSAFELLSLARNDRVFYRIIGPDGANLTGYDDLPLPGRPSDAGEQVYETRYMNAPIRAVMLTRQLAERALSGKLTVIVAQTTEERAALAQSITTQAVVPIIVIGALLLVLAQLLLRFALRPLDRLQRVIRARDSHDLSPLDLDVPREVGVLIEAINRFMGRLDRRIEAMQGFVADAAHQIRTPITALRAQSQLALDEKDEQRLARLHQRIHARALGLSRLADQLLSQALVSHRADAEPFETIDLRRVAVDAEREIRTLADSDAVGCSLVLPDEAVSVKGDALSLREAVKNLLNNAFRHGLPPVELVVERSGGAVARIAVRDGGKGLPAGMAERIGERFATSGITPDSAGLGLAIVAQVARSHHGSVAARTGGRGFEIAIELPLLVEGK